MKLKEIFANVEFFIRPLLIPLHSDVYYTNTSSLPEMKNVLVLTMPNTRSYRINPDLKDNNTVSKPEIHNFSLCSASVAIQKRLALIGCFCSAHSE